jgi:hypothetical protein
MTVTGRAGAQGDLTGIRLVLWLSGPRAGRSDVLVDDLPGYAHVATVNRLPDQPAGAVP